MKIAILGGGNAGFAFAGHLSWLGHQISLYENEVYAKSIERVKKSNKIKLTGYFNTEQTVKVTTNIEEASKEAELIIIAVPAYAQETMFDSYVKYAKEGQTVVFFPGNYAALRFYRKLTKLNMQEEITIAEADSIPYGARKTKGNEVRILGMKNKLYLASIPSYKTKNVAELLNREIYDIFEEAPNVLYSSLNNGNCIIHCPTAVLNAGWIETSKGEFSFYWEGMTPSVCKVLEESDKELLNIAGLFGMKTVTQKDFFIEYYGIGQYETLYETIQQSEAHGLSKAPKTLKDRYIKEDVPFGLVPISTLSRQFGIRTPTIDSIIHLANVLNDENYYETGITPLVLGINNLTKDEILRLVNLGV